MASSRGKRSLLRRQLGALGAALRPNTAFPRVSTRKSASHDATVGQPRAVREGGEAAIPASNARAPAVATVVVLAALCCMSAARADSGAPPATTPTSTTPDAPPPDPYKPPAPASKPKPVTRPTVVRSAPVYHAPVRTYTPTYRPAPASTLRVRTVQPHHTARTHRPKVAHRHKARVVHRHVAAKPKPVKVTFSPFANLVAASSVLDAANGSSDRDRFLRLAGLAFAVLAAAGLSLHTLVARTVR
jgi:hypothetical protein